MAERLEGEERKDDYCPGRTLYLDAKGNVVEANSNRKQVKLCGDNGRIPLEQAKALGLVKEPEDEPDAAPAEAAVIPAPVETTAVMDAPETTHVPGPREQARKPAQKTHKPKGK